MQHIRAQRFNVKKIPDGKRKIRKSVALELDKDGKNAISFGTHNPLGISSSSQVGVMADEAPIQFIKELKWVAFKPQNNGKVDLGDYALEKFTTGKSANMSTTLLNNLEAASAENTKEQFNYRSQHPCAMLDTKAMLEGGRSCSRAVYGAGDAPVAFYLNKSISSPFGEMRFPFGTKNQKKTKFSIDHFLIPTIMEGNTVVWMAIEKKNSKKAIRASLNPWRRSNFDVAAFSGFLLTSDDLSGMIICFDGKPKKSKKI
jgi:hypothetical protein